MPHRQFKDYGDILWEVWDVHPLEIAGRLIGNGEIDDSLRRRSRSGVSRELAAGWLCFESAQGGKRRLHPIPVDWDRLSDEQLQELWTQAKHAPTRRTAP